MASNENQVREKYQEAIMLCTFTTNVRNILVWILLLKMKYGFSKIKNLGVDFSITMSIVEAMNDEKFELLKPLLNHIASYESCTGMSNHAVLVCRNQ